MKAQPPSLRKARRSASELQTRVTEAFIVGAASVRKERGAVFPCRLPLDEEHLFPPGGGVLWSKAFCTSGVRLRVETDATSLTLHFEPLAEAGVQGNGAEHCFDAVVNNEILQVLECGQGAASACFDRIGSGRRVVELWLPPGTSIGLKSLTARGGSMLQPSPDRRPLWVTWGSSLTQCTRAASAARIWPATVARQHNLNLRNLGFGGSCLLEPMIASMIRDFPAKMISMELGINALENLSARLFAPLVVAAVRIVREKHPRTPLVLISPMASPPRETTPSRTDYTLEGMRRDMEAVWHDLRAAGDKHLHLVNGLDWFGIDDIRRYATDDLHPGAEGIDLQAHRFSELVMPLFSKR